MNDLATISREIEPVEQETSQINQLLADYQIETQEDLDWSNRLLKHTKANLKGLEEKRKSITAPIKEGIKRIEDLFRPATTQLAESERILKLKIGEYVASQERARRATMQASAIQYANGGTPTEIIPEPPKAEGLTVRNVWDFRVTDLALVPREYLSVSESKIRAARDMYLQDGNAVPPAIPGIEFFQTQQVSVRTTK